MTGPLKDGIAVFKSGAQRAFIETVEKKYSVEKIAKICLCSPRTIRDWRREKFNMQLACARSLSHRAYVPLPKNITIRSRYAHTSRAGRKGSQAVMAKYGRVPVDETVRREKWQKWWKKVGQFRQPLQFQAKDIYKPHKSVELAEFIGTMMGDGGLSKYQACITLHHVDDRQYIDFVAKRINDLFRIKPSLYHIPEDSVYNIVVSRLEIVRYLHSLGLPIGNKVRQQFDIPEWIKKNKEFTIACVRGLVDTDGSIFVHSYKVKGKLYSYKKLSFCSRSQPLQYTVARILTDLGMRARISGYDVRLDSIADMKKYMTIVGSSNPKHLKRYAS
ncbi:hypothetical protein HY969_03710 [Candidatus Kaiserbacteria bacterium]|nr:hypothetical protein [Candidatus Kaiserbacteria bacterium]